MSAPLPNTGSSAGVVAAIGAIALTVGAALLAAARRGAARRR